MNEQFDPSKTVENIAGDISDNSHVDWDEALERVPQAARTLEQLRMIERVAMAHRSARGDGDGDESGAPADLDQPLFTWGALQVLEKIGEGGFAEVYRAWDPKLHRQVALKLRRDDEAASSQWIEEARRLAGVRHPNVLVIHGAATHDERQGIWTDLIEGGTLAEWVQEHGVLGAREAAIVVMDVCLALAAVHSSGLVHGDVKASNVMRESGGRLVLMDFGSVHRLDEPAGGRHSGTPLITAPELLDGAAATPASDVYALGVLLYWLVSGEYPVEAETVAELQTRLKAGESVTLRERRPDLSRAFVQIVDKALAADADARWRGPSELEMALAGLLASRPPVDVDAPRQLLRRRPMVIGLILVLAMIAIGVTWLARDGSVDRSRERSPFERVIVAGSDLSVELGMVSVIGGELRTLAPGSALAPGMGLALQLSSPDSTHVYVLNEDENGELFVLFPLDGVDLTNPLAGGRTHVLPGRRNGRQQSWVVTSAGGIERFLAIVSRQRLPDLERAIAEFRRASRDRSVESSSLLGGLRESVRGVGGVADVEVGSSRGDGDMLGRIAASLIESTDDPDGLWVWGVSFSNSVGGMVER